MQPGGELGLALELADPLHELHERLLGCVASVLGVAQHVQGDPLHPRSVPLAERRQCLLVSVFRASHKNGVRESLVHERPVGPQVTHDSTRAAAGRLHAPTLVPMGLTPAVVLPALRGSYGREYHYAEVTETTQRMLPADASHGAVALAERQTAGRGRLGRTWVDSALMFSVALYPPQPVARWPGLTLVAAEAVAGAVGPAAAIKHPNDVLIDGRKVAGILAEAGERVVLGIGINVGEAGWPGAGFVEPRQARAARRRARAPRARLRAVGGYAFTTALRFPAASCAWAESEATLPWNGTVNTPLGSAITIRVAPLTSTVTVAGSSRLNLSA